MTRHLQNLLPAIVAAACLLGVTTTLANPSSSPNIIIILTDDMGYGDIGAYGATRIQTPHIDEMADRGLTLTNGYASANVCTPSRAGLLTGRYPIRSGLAWKVLEANDSRALPPSEETIAELVKRAGYKTGMVGKWHLGGLPKHNPLIHGFDYFYGVPHSNDMPGFALYEGTREIESPVNQGLLTQRYTGAATAFIDEHPDHPFLLFFAHTFPHIPLYASEAFAGKSAAGVYGDVIEEIDWSTGEIVAALKRNNLLDNTLLIFTSDNGPFFEGSTRGLKGGKGNTWEGGYRVPFIISWPEIIEAGRVDGTLTANIDLLPTIAEILELQPSADLVDGSSMLGIFRNETSRPARYFYYFNNEAVVGLRDQEWKYLTHTYYTGSIGAFEKFDQLPGFNASYDLLFDARGEDGEAYSVADRHPDVLLRMQGELASSRKEFDKLRTRPAETTYPR